MAINAGRAFMGTMGTAYMATGALMLKQNPAAIGEAISVASLGVPLLGIAGWDKALAMKDAAKSAVQKLPRNGPDSFTP